MALLGLCCAAEKLTKHGHVWSWFLAIQTQGRYKANMALPTIPKFVGSHLELHWARFQPAQSVSRLPVAGKSSIFQYRNVKEISKIECVHNFHNCHIMFTARNSLQARSALQPVVAGSGPGSAQYSKAFTLAVYLKCWSANKDIAIPAYRCPWFPNQLSIHKDLNGRTLANLFCQVVGQAKVCKYWSTQN